MSLDMASSGVKSQFTGDPDQFKILIASDVHLGFSERHHLRGTDSFDSFEEVLQAAQRHDVDLILLAGDLFHVNKPSIGTMNRASALIRKYCFGEYDDENSGPRFHIRGHKQANFLDPNLKVRYPIFTIHGNHDDPTGVNQTSVIDLLDSSGLVNYIGKRNHIEDVVLKPIVLEKGQTKIILYGLGSMHEERLHHLIKADKFNYMQPDDDLTKYFKIVLVHQNRIPRPNTKYLNPADLDELPDLVIWGHEHGCPGELEYFEGGNFFILQPGSTVATSLSDAEAGDKCYGIMTVNFDPIKEKPRFKVKMHKLETVRPFLTKTVSADELLKKKKFKTTEEAQEYLYNVCKSEINEMIQTVRVEYDTDMLPLIRLRVEFTDREQQFDVKKFTRELDLKVANPDELIRFVKRTDVMAEYRKVMDEAENFNMVEMMSILDNDVVKQQIQVSNIMSDYFGNATNENHKLGLFAERYLTNKVVDFVEKDTAEVFSDLVGNYKTGIISMLGDHNQIDFDNLKEEIKNAKEKIEGDNDLLMGFDKVIQKAKAGKFMKSQAAAKKTEMNDSFGDDSDGRDIDMPSTSKAVAAMAPTRVVTEPSPKRGRGRPRKNPIVVKSDDDIEMIPESDFDTQSPKKVQAQPVKRGRGRPRTRPLVEVDSDEVELIEESDMEEKPSPPKKATATRGRGGTRGRGRGRGRPAKASNNHQSSVFDEDTEEDEDTTSSGKITSFFSRRTRN